MPSDERSARYVAREERPLRREVLIEPLAELGLVAMDGPNDPEPSLVISDGSIVEIDGRSRENWDALDHFVASYGIDVQIAQEAASLSDVELARKLVDVDAERSELVRAVARPYSSPACTSGRHARSGRVDVRAEEAGGRAARRQTRRT